MRAILLFLTLLSISCDRDNPVTPLYPIDNTNEELRIIFKDTLSDKLFGSLPLHLSDNALYYSYQLENFTNRLQKRDTQSGDVIWESSEIYGSGTIDESMTFYENGNIYHGTCNYIVSLNLETGLENWQSNEIDHCHLANIGAHLYGAKSHGNPVDSTSIISIDKTTGQVRDIMQLHREDDRHPDMRAMTGYVNENGDEIIIALVNMDLDYNSINNSADIYCYNATQDTLIWQIKDIEDEPMLGYLINQAGTPKIDLDNQLVYLHFAKAMYCLELSTGVVIWNRYFTETNMLSGNHILYEDKLIWQDDLGYLLAVDRFTGELLYRKFINDGTFSTAIAIWRGKVLMAYHKIQLADPATGEIWRSIDIPLSGIDKDVSLPVFDESKKRMYFTDGHAIVCAEIPDSWLE
jgi:outer membrane protein assembly factor BamB